MKSRFDLYACFWILTKHEGLEEAELQAKTEELKTQEQEKKTEILVKLKKIGKMKELIGGIVTITLTAGE